MNRRLLVVLQAVIAIVLLLSFSQSARAAQIEDVEFLSHGVRLSGSLMLPDGRLPLAALVLVHGSGPENRMSGLARVLASDGFAVLTYDKRGVGRSGGEYWGTEPNKENIASVNLNLLADDAVAGAQAVAKHPGLGTVPLGFVGISQAGWIIPIAATRYPMTKFIALWSGPVCTVSEQLHFQFLAMNDQDFWKTHTKAQVAQYMGSGRFVIGRPDDTDPRTSLTKISIPGFWLFGDQDNLVPVDLSVARLDGFSRQGHSNFQHVVIAGYGHMLGGINSNTPPYAKMVAWIKETVSRLPRSRK
jgi:pimeloyl-ACP methyl ester carboxylesterase